MASGGNIASCKASWKDDHNPFIPAMITTVLLLLGGELQRILGVWVASQRAPLTLPTVLVYANQWYTNVYYTSKGNGSPGMQTSPTPPPTAEKGKYTIHLFLYCSQ